MYYLKPCCHKMYIDFSLQKNSVNFILFLTELNNNLFNFLLSKYGRFSVISFSRFLFNSNLFSAYSSPEYCWRYCLFKLEYLVIKGCKTVPISSSNLSLITFLYGFQQHNRQQYRRIPERLLLMQEQKFADC